MGIISKLPLDVSEKIAAGEVIERPESVIKELVENSIDAGADKISVEIKNGGVTYMKVTDNGSGMSKEDAELSFTRHATSKISRAEDLESIHTMGFRGEALASICAVSEVNLYTKRDADEIGTHIFASAGDIRKIEDVAANSGTIFIVESLFYNLPARLKFLKKDATEAAAIENIMVRFILCHPEISFRFINNGKEKLFSPGDNSLVNSVYSVYGRDFAKAVTEFDISFPDIRIYGVLGKAELARPKSTYESFFINKRYVISPVIKKALEEAYKNRIMIGKFPTAVINVELDPSKIDINVHPKKTEVKFSDPSMIYQAVYRAVSDTLSDNLDIPQIEMAKEREPEKPVDIKEILGTAKTPISALNFHEENISMVKPVSRPKKPYVYETNHDADYYEKEKLEYIGKLTKEEILKNTLAGIPSAISRQARKAEKTVQEKIEDVQVKETEETKETIKTAPGNTEELKKHEIRVVGQVFDTYIIIESEGQILFIDQHAAHERIMYEKLKAELKTNSVVSQMMLVPAVISMSATEFDMYNSCSQELTKMGFETENFGDNSVLVRSTPYDMNSEDLEELIINLITNLSDNKNEAITEKQDRLLYTIACKAAIKANHKLSLQEQESLAEKVLNFDNINTCPHGRPITISMTKKELEKNFKRIV